MKKKKLIFLCLIVTVMIIGSLSGCNKTKEKDVEEPIISPTLVPSISPAATVTPEPTEQEQEDSLIDEELWKIISKEAMISEDADFSEETNRLAKGYQELLEIFYQGMDFTNKKESESININQNGTEIGPYYQITDQRYQSREHLEKAVLEIFTRKTAYQLFFSWAFEGKNPYFVEQDGKLYVSKNKNGKISFEQDKVTYFGMKEDSYKAAFPLSEDSSGSQKLILYIRNAEEGWRVEGHYRAETELKKYTGGTILFAVNSLSCPQGMPVQMDLDGDGEQEIIFYDLVPSEEMGFLKQRLWINGDDFTEYLETEGTIFPEQGYYFLMDVDRSDSFIELLLLDAGPSSDEETLVYRYQDHKLTKLGSVPGYPEDFGYADKQISVNGDGTIETNAYRLSILQTWFTSAVWKLEDGTLQFVPADLYYPNQSNIEVAFPYKLLMELPIYQEPSDRSATTQKMKAQMVNITATDNEHWCKIIGEDQTEGWFYVEDYSSIADLGLMGSEVFENLTFYD